MGWEWLVEEETDKEKQNRRSFPAVGPFHQFESKATKEGRLFLPAPRFRPRGSLLTPVAVAGKLSSTEAWGGGGGEPGYWRA